MISELLIAKLNRDEALKQFCGVEDIRLPDKRHKKIIDAVVEVATKLGLSHVDVLVHSGIAESYAYLPEYDCLLISEKLQLLLTDNELKAVTTHELDHKTNYHLLKEESERMRLASLNDLAIALAKVRSRMEFSADDKAAELYGAENMESALISTIVNADNPIYRRLILNDQGSNNPASGIKEIITQRLHEVASGKAKTLLPEIDERLRRLHQKQPHGR